MTTIIDLKTKRRSVIVDKIAEDTRFYPSTDCLKILKLFIIFFFHIDVVSIAITPNEPPIIYLVPIKAHRYLGNQPLSRLYFYWCLWFRRQAIQGSPNRSASFYLNTLSRRYNVKIHVVRIIPKSFIKNS